MPMSEPIMGWCIQCGKEHDGFYCPKDPNPPKNASYWKRKTVEASMHIDVLLRYAHYGTVPTEDDLAVIEAIEFLRHIPKPR